MTTFDAEDLTDTLLLQAWLDINGNMYVADARHTDWIESEVPETAVPVLTDIGDPYPTIEDISRAYIDQSIVGSFVHFSSEEVQEYFNNKF